MWFDSLRLYEQPLKQIVNLSDGLVTNHVWQIFITKGKQQLCNWMIKCVTIMEIGLYFPIISWLSACLTVHYSDQNLLVVRCLSCESLVVTSDAGRCKTCLSTLINSSHHHETGATCEATRRQWHKARCFISQFFIHPWLFTLCIFRHKQQWRRMGKKVHLKRPSCHRTATGRPWSQGLQPHKVHYCLGGFLLAPLLQLLSSSGMRSFCLSTGSCKLN